MGVFRRQVSAAVAWEATVLTGVALAIGMPVGVAAGRSVWSFFARHLGAVPDPHVPLVPLLLGVPVAIAVANLIAFGPGWAAGRLKPAAMLPFAAIRCEPKWY